MHRKTVTPQGDTMSSRNAGTAPPSAVVVLPLEKRIGPLINSRLSCGDVLWCEGLYRRTDNKSSRGTKPDMPVVELGKRIGQGIGGAMMFLAVLTALGWEGLFPAAGPKGRTLAERLSEN